MTDNSGDEIGFTFNAHGEGHYFVMPAMTMREAFAMNEKSNPPVSWLIANNYGDDLEKSGCHKREALVKWRYEMADAMVYAYQKEQGK